MNLQLESRSIIFWGASLYVQREKKIFHCQVKGGPIFLLMINQAVLALTGTSERGKKLSVRKPLRESFRGMYPIYYLTISYHQTRSDLYKLLCPSFRQFARTSLYRLLNASLLAPRSTFFQHLFMSNYPTCTELFSMFSCNIYLCTYIFIFVRFFVDAYQCEFTYLSEIPTYKHTYIHAILLQLSNERRDWLWFQHINNASIITVRWTLIDRRVERGIEKIYV